MESNFNPDNEEIEDLALFPSENQNPIIRANLNQILYINKSGKELLDIQKDSKLPEILKEHISESLFSKKNQEFELVLNDQTYSFTITPIKEKDYANIYGRDITERKKIEEQLIYKDNIISSTSSVIATCDLDGIMNFVNPAFFKVWGYDNTNEIYGRHFKEFWVVEPILDEIMDVLTSKGVWFGEIKAKKKDGSFFDVQVSASLVYDNEGDPISLMSSSIDITARKKAEEKLYHEQDLIHTLLDNHPDFIYFKDSKARFQHISKRFCDFFGRNKEDIIGKTDLELFPEELAAQTHSEDLNVIKTGIPLINKEETDGETWVLSTKMPWLEKDGNIKGLFGISRDITDLKKAEQFLTESEEKFKNIAEQNLMGICILQDNVIKYINKAMAEIYGYTIEEILNWEPMEYFKLFTPESLEIVREQSIKKQKGDPDQIVHYIIHGVKRTGELIWVDNISRTINYEGRPADLITEIEITEKLKTEQDLKESEEKFRTLSEQSLVGIAIVQDNQMKYSNRKIAEIIEYPYEEIKDWTLIDHLKIVHPDHVDFVKEQAMKKQQGITDVMEDYEFCIYTKKGDLKWVHVFSKTISYEGRPADLVVQIDITKRKKIEEQLIKSEENYRVAYNNANFYKDLFAHDMNNILNSIRLSVELISETPKEGEKMEKFNKFFNIIKDSSNRGAQLISNVQKLSKLDESGAIIQDTNVSTYLKDAVSFIKNNFPNKDIEIEVDALSENILVMGNELLLDVFENIMINSVKYNDNKKKEILIKISEIQADGITFLKLEFIDNGMGIKHYRKEKIFEVGNREYKGGRGMGIGLSLVKKIVESYGGKIMVEDKVPGDYSKGSNFIVLIPKSK